MTSNIIESCLEINDRDQNGVRASFQGLIQDAPSATSTSIVNGLSQQLIYQLQLIVPNAFVSFDDLNVDLLDAAFPYVQASAKQALQGAIQDRGMKMQVNSAYRTIAQQMLLYNDRFNLIKGRFPVPWGVRSAKKWLFHTPSACGGVVD